MENITGTSMSKEYLEIRRILENKADEKVKASFQKFIPSSQKVYGVKVPELNSLAMRYKKNGFELVGELWKSGVFEERLLATKILGCVCKKDPEKTMEFIEKISKEVSDWAVCDTLGTQGVRKISKFKQKKIFELSRKLIKSSNFWERRLALVLLINYKKEKNLKKEIFEIINIVESDKEHYVRKAVDWLKREIKK